MRENYHAANLDEALALAIDFKKSGKYNLFRGQAQNWPVVTTAGRLSQEDYKKETETIRSLHDFFSTHDPLKKYVNDVDWFYAVAQHYSVPTNYLDFTEDPKVAAYFATHSTSNQIGKESIIICLDQVDFENFLNKTSQLYRNAKIPPHLLSIDVDNLWRLQAQSGRFLYTPYGSIEQYYDFDRIFFPFTEPYQGIKTDEIYPERKSELEILLDQFFNAIERRQKQADFDRMAEQIHMPRVIWPSIVVEDSLKSTDVHISWQSPEYSQWNYQVIERWGKLQGIINLHLNLEINSSKISQQINLLYDTIVKQFRELHINRTSNLTVTLSADFDLQADLYNKIVNSCIRIWDGCRNLPYTLEEIALIVSKYICLELNDTLKGSLVHITEEPMIALEMTNTFGSKTRSFASESKIVSAFRDDLREVLSGDSSNQIDSSLLMLINKPRFLFDFKKLVSLFKDELVSYQVWYNSENSNPVIFYTPSQIDILGYL